MDQARVEAPGRRRARDAACRDCALRRVRLFRPLGDDEMDAVSGMAAGQLARPAGAHLLASGPAEGHIHTLHAGWAFRSIRLADGSRQILEFLLPGDVFGLHVALLGQWDYEVTALTRVVLCRLRAPDLDTTLGRFPGLCKAMLRTLIEDKRRADDRLAVLGRTQGPQRIAHLMLEIAERLEQSGAMENGCCDFPLRRRHLADATGLSGTHVTRSLADLRGRGLAWVENDRLTIADGAALAAFAGYTPAARRPGRLVV